MSNFDLLTPAQSLQAAQEYLAGQPATRCPHDPNTENHNEACMPFENRYSADEPKTIYGNQVVAPNWVGNIHSKTGDMPCKWTYWEKSVYFNQFRKLEEIPAAVCDRTGLMFINVPKNVSLASIKETLLAMPAGLKINLDGEDRIYQDVYPQKNFYKSNDGVLHMYQQTSKRPYGGGFVIQEVSVPINQETLETTENPFEGWQLDRRY